MFTPLILLSIGALLAILFLGLAILWSVHKCPPENISINVGIGGSLMGSTKASREKS